MLQLLSHPSMVLAALLTLAPFFSAAFWPGSLQLIWKWPVGLRILAPALLARARTMVPANFPIGVVVANRLAGDSAERLRAALTDALSPEPVATGPPSLAPSARVAERQTQAA